MHEFSIAEGLVNTVLAELEKQPAGVQLKKTRVVIGDMRQVVTDTLTFAYKTLTRDTPAAGSELDIVTRPVTLHCRACGWRGAIDDRLFVCAECGARDVEVATGKELYLESLEISDDE